MNDIHLENGTIHFDGEWLTANDLTRKIQEKITAGDMKLAALATALETLNTALEDARTIDIQLVLTRDQYDRLRAFGGDDDCECIRKAVRAFIQQEDTGSVSGSGRKVTIKCPQCGLPIKVSSSERPLLIECQQCGITGRLTANNRWARIDR